MKAMILAAGRGERMGHLTEHCPKPLLKINGQCLIEYHLKALQRANIRDVIINTAYLAEQIHSTLGDGSKYGLRITFSHEGDEGLETAGGITKALPLLGNHPFIVINADIWTDYDLAQLTLNTKKLAHLVLVKNPVHNPRGDFGIDTAGLLTNAPKQYTFSGIGMYSPQLFANQPCTKQALAPVLRAAIEQTEITGELYSGEWMDVGTPERLSQLNAPFEPTNNNTAQC